MKKVIALFIICLLCIGFTGCTSSSNKQNTSKLSSDEFGANLNEPFSADVCPIRIEDIVVKDFDYNTKTLTIEFDTTIKRRLSNVKFYVTCFDKDNNPLKSTVSSADKITLQHPNFEYKDTEYQNATIDISLGVNGFANATSCEVQLVEVTARDKEVWKPLKPKKFTISVDNPSYQEVDNKNPNKVAEAKATEFASNLKALGYDLTFSENYSRMAIYGTGYTYYIPLPNEFENDYEGSVRQDIKWIGCKFKNPTKLMPYEHIFYNKEKGVELHFFSVGKQGTLQQFSYLRFLTDDKHEVKNDIPFFRACMSAFMKFAPNITRDRVQNIIDKLQPPNDINFPRTLKKELYNNTHYTLENTYTPGLNDVTFYIIPEDIVHIEHSNSSGLPY